MSRPITESQNPLTMNIDAADGVGIVRLLRQSDAQMFAGYETWPAITDVEMMEALARLGYRMSRLLHDRDNVVFLTGAGTSGRFAHLHSLEFNRVLRENKLAEVFRPLIAGGEAALIRAQEAAEDSASAAVRDLNQALFPTLKRGMYIGITAGLSAPYVAAQVDVLLGMEKFYTVMLGFNPAERARAAVVDGWDKSVKDIVDAGQENDRFILLNPVYGPEPITGSTRMKGGSTTKIALDVAFAVALDLARKEGAAAAAAAPYSAQEEDAVVQELLPSVRKYLLRYARLVQAAYSEVPALGELVKLAGTALRSGGRIVYLGRGIAAYLGIIDASECPPTFGAKDYDVRGYLLEGWEYLGYNTATMRNRGKVYEVDHAHFEADVLPELSKGDLVIGIANGLLGENTRRLLGAAHAAKASTALIFLTTDKASFTSPPPDLRQQVIVEVPEAGFIPGTNNLMELALKLCLNAVTSGAHIMAGKVYTNVMIDLKISNSKLYDRAIRLIGQLTGASPVESEIALQTAIFRHRPSDDELKANTVSMCLQRAAGREKIVPTAILMATGKFTLPEAEERLATEPRVRKIIEEVVGEARKG